MPDLQHAVARAIKTLGLAEVTRRLGTNRETTLRLAIGAEVRNGSIALAAANLHRLDEAPGARRA